MKIFSFNNGKKYPLVTMIPARIVLTLLGFFGYINLYAMRVNLSVAMVAMVGKPSASNTTNITIDTCPELIVFRNQSKGNESTGEGEFHHWDSYTQGQVIGSFFYGYAITQIPGGFLAEKYGAKWIYGLGVLITALFTLLTPVAARWSVWALLAVRVGEGLAGGVAFPAMNVLIGRWVPKMERSRIATCMNMGVFIGTLITNALTGFLCQSTFLGGWPSVFYTCGLSGCIWFVFWVFLAYETPDSHPRISKSELIYIKEGQDKVTNKDVKTPWKSIWTSMPLWAIIVAHFGQNWAFYTLLTMMPTYLSNILHFELESNGIVSGLPYLMQALFAVAASIVADGIRQRDYLRITTLRKILNSIAFFGPGVCSLCIAFAGCRPTLIICLFSLSFGLNGFIFSAYMVNHVDMSPQFAGTLMGITNGIATLPGFLAPAYVGKVLESGQTLRNWGIVFITTSAIHFLAAIFYDVFASAELQPWNDANPDHTDEKKAESLSNNIECSVHL